MFSSVAWFRSLILPAFVTPGQFSGASIEVKV